MPTLNVSTPELLAVLLTDHHALLIRVVQSHFPKMCVSRVEDAVSGAYEALAREPERFLLALQSRGLAWMVGLAITIACRDARDQVKRQAYSREVGAPSGDPTGVIEELPFPDLELALDIQRRLEPLIVEAANSAGPRWAPQLLNALIEKLETGDEDTAVAARHGLRREYVNRAWSQVRRELSGAPPRKAA